MRASWRARKPSAKAFSEALAHEQRRGPIGADATTTPEAAPGGLLFLGGANGVGLFARTSKPVPRPRLRHECVQKSTKVEQQHAASQKMRDQRLSLGGVVGEGGLVPAVMRKRAGHQVGHCPDRERPAQGEFQQASAKPVHSMISPRWLGQEHPVEQAAPGDRVGLRTRRVFAAPQGCDRRGC